jgi:hypothetical protein
MNLGIKTRPTTADHLLAVVRMFDDLRDPARRAEIMGAFEAEHAKLQAAREAAENYAAGKAAEAAEHEKRGDDAFSAALLKANAEMAAAKAEAERLINVANDYTKSQNSAIAVERTKLAGERALALADKEAADKAFAQARDLADKAAADRAEAQKVLAEAGRVQVENARKAQAAERLAKELA